MVYPKRVNGLEIQPAEDGYIVYQAELDRVHYLNPTAVLILELSDGARTAKEIAALAAEAYGAAAVSAKAVEEAIAKMAVAGLMQ
ncbi:MAG TPA: PqqD family peptide modification chaperone [Terriglobales bacterium]